MTRASSLLRVVLIGLSGFLAVSSIPGGVALLAGLNAPPVEMLAGSIFSSYLLPGLVLLLIVGGSALLSTVLLVRRSRLASASAVFAGAIVMTYEFVEVLAIGSPPGLALALQVLYFSNGIALVCVGLLQIVLTDSRPLFRS